jgi:hypothetical protein
MKIYYKKIMSDGHHYCVFDTSRKIVINKCKQLVAEQDYYYEAYVEPEVEVTEIPISKDGIITAMLRGAELAGDCDTLVPVTKKELKAAWTATAIYKILSQ